MKKLELPKIGFGTYGLRGNDCTRSVLTALKVGYRFIDTAEYYNNEGAVGKALMKTSVPRDEVIVATKLWTDHLGDKDVIPAAQTCLNRLDLSYIDLLYVHWPGGVYRPEVTIPRMNQLVDKEIVRYIGVSNFNKNQIENAKENSKYPIYFNQVECHPYKPKNGLFKYMQDNQMELIAYSPLAKGRMLKDETLSQIGNKYNASAAQ